MHASGLFAALSKETSQLCLEIARVAKRHGSKMSFDLNHRASFWKGREKELAETFAEIASCADILVGNEEDFSLPGLQGTGGRRQRDGGQDRELQGDDQQVKAKYSNAPFFATTLREVKSVSLHKWGACSSPAANGR